MSSPVTPACEPAAGAATPPEKMTAWQRWELAALGESQSRVRRPVKLPTAEELERVHQNAHAEGFAAGLAEGRAQIARRAAAFDTLIASLGRELRAGEAAVADDLLSFALSLAQRMVREALAVRPELVLPLVREAMQQMPLFNAATRLALHPADAALVREALGEALAHAGCRIVEEPGLERGGCRIEGTATQVDATPATRWERIVFALGRDHAWLEDAPPRPERTR